MKTLANYVKYCPALPRIAARVYRGNVDRMLPRALRLLEQNQTLVITGTNRKIPIMNRNAGKTPLAQEIKSKLEAQGKKVAYYNLQEQLDLAFLMFTGLVNDEVMQLMLKELGRQDVYIFDEAQWSLVTEAHPSKLYNELKTLFWKKVDGLLEGNKKIIFVALDHPFDPTNREHFYDQTSVRYYTSPIIEVESACSSPQKGV